MIDPKSVRLRAARMRDVPLLIHWDHLPHVAQTAPNDDPWYWASIVFQNPYWRWIWIAEVSGVPVGVMVVIDPAAEETHYWGDCGPGLRAVDIWIGEKTYLGRGVGTAMMREALRRCFADPTVQGVLIDPLASNVRAHRFYRRIGYRFVEIRRFDRDLCHVYRIERHDWDRQAS